MITVAGLCGVGLFFAGLGTEDLLASQFGTGRFLSDNDVITALGTLFGSVLAVVVVPLGLLGVGIATVRANVLPTVGRWAAASLAPALLLGAVVSAATEPTWISGVWLILYGICWSLLGLGVLRPPGSHRT